MLLICQMPLCAQQKNNGLIPWGPKDFHSLLLWGSLGQSTLNVDLEPTSFVGRIGGNAGLGYAYTFSYQWTVSAGLELALYSAAAKPYSFADSSSWIDTEGDPFTMRYQYNGYREQQYSQYLNIPLSVGYTCQRFHLAAGAKLGVHLRSSYATSIRQLKTTAYYPQFGSFGNMPNHDLIDRPHQARSSMALGANVTASVEVGVNLIQRRRETILRLAVFYDYGVNNLLRRSAKKGLVEYGKLPTDIRLHSIVESDANSRHSATLSMVGIKLTRLLKSKPVDRRYKCNCSTPTYSFPTKKAAP